MILIIDNYDSFTYNLVHLVGRYRDDLSVVRNDAVSVDDVEEMEPDLIVISPGRAVLQTPEYPSRRFGDSAVGRPFWGSASGIRPSAKYSAER